MPASNKGKKRVQISVCFRSFLSQPWHSGECQPGAGKAGLLDAYETWLLSPAILYTFPLPPSFTATVPPHMCLYNCRAFVIKLERIIVCHISKLRQGQRLPIAYFPDGGQKEGQQLCNPWPIYEQVEFVSSVRVCVLVVALIFNLIALAFLMRLRWESVSPSLSGWRRVSM